MATAITVRSVADALVDATRWRSDEESRFKAQTIEVDQQLGELRQTKASLEEKIASLEQFRDGLGGRTDELRVGEARRAHDGLFAALEEQRDALEQRTAQLRAAEARRVEMLETVLSESDLAGKLVEFKQFKEAVEPSLAAMPESYRSVVMGHHEGVASVLRERVAELMSDPVHAEGDLLQLEVAFAVDAPNDQPELLVIVTPVASNASDVNRPEDLQTRLAARVVQAIYEACHEVGLETVSVAAGGHRGLLAIEADVIGAPSSIAAEIEKRLHTVFRAALELTAAKVQLTARGVHPDHIFGPMDEDEDEDEELLDVE